MNEFYYYLLYFTSEYFSLPLIIRITLFLIVLLLLLYLTFFGRVVYISLFQFLEKKKAQRLELKYASKLQSLLEQSNLESDKIRAEMGWTHKVPAKTDLELLTMLLIRTRNAISGFNVHNYSVIVEILQLRKYWKRIVEKESTFSSSRALKILGDLELESSETLQGLNIKTKDKDLQKYARSVFFDVSSSDLWESFDRELSSDFTSLDEIRLHRALRRKAAMRPLPSLMRWVQRSDNEDFKAFLVKEISFFKQKESMQSLMKLLKETTSSKLKIQIITTLGELGCKEAVPLLCSEFHYNSARTQQAIIAALATIGVEKSLKFLEFEYNHCKNQDLLIDLVRGIYTIDEKQKTGTYEQLKSTSASLFTSSIFSFVEREKVVLS